MNRKICFERTRLFVASCRWRSIARWLIVACCFSAGSIGMLYVLVDLLLMPLTLATFLTAEIATVLRFFVNNRWVFDDRAATWTGLWQFHGANAGGFVIWWVISNLLPYYGVHYIVAATAGIAGSVVFNMFANFQWIWRKERKTASSISCEDKSTAKIAD
jgi:putative flippase GtrA